MLKNLQRILITKAYWQLWRFQAAMVLRLGAKTKDLQVTKSNNIYTSINTLPFDRFLCCLIDGLYSPICREYDMDVYQYRDGAKIPDILELVKAWKVIEAEFSEHIGGSDNLYYIDLLATMGRLESKLERLDYILVSLQVAFNENLVADLKKMGINTVPTPEDLKIEKIQNEAKRWVLQLNQKKAEYLGRQTKATDAEIKEVLFNFGYDLNEALALLSDKVEKKPPTYELYEKILSEIDPKLQAKDVTTLRVCILYGKLKARIKQRQADVAGKDK